MSRTSTYMQKHGKNRGNQIPRTRTWVEDTAPQNPLPYIWTARLRSRQGTPRHQGKKRGLSVRDRNNVKENHRHITWKRRRGKNVSTEKRKTKGAPQPQRGGAGRNWTIEKERGKATQSCATVGVAKIPRTPRRRGRGDRQDEKEANTKKRQSCVTT